MSFKTTSVLLFNPWIYDFAAYDFWCKPLGLLYLGARLRELGCRVHLIDCLDRFHPQLLRHVGQSTAKSKSDVSGKFHREIIPKPQVVAHVPRYYARYGMPPEVVHQLLDAIEEPPQFILVTSFMTYWYPAVRDAVALLRDRFPHAEILLGGIYATLAPEHAQQTVRPDVLLRGEAEHSVVEYLASRLGVPAPPAPQHLDELPVPAFDLYPRLKSVALMTSRGCPNRCSFCASHALAAGYRRRSVQHVVAEIQHWARTYQVQHMAFFDDALLHRADECIKPILWAVIESKLDVRFYTPNGLTTRFIDAELAELFYASGVQNVRLSFETINPERQKRMSSKVTSAELQRAVQHLFDAGYAPDAIGVYVLMGLPGQHPEEVMASAEFVHRLGVNINLASFSPLPGTLEWQNAIHANLWQPQNDFLLTNTTLFPIWSQTVGYAAAVDVDQQVKSMNQRLRKE